MFCGKCGKEMSSTEKFCPSCGAPNPDAAAVRPASGGTPVVPAQLKGKSVYRIALVILGVIQPLIYFCMSYGQMGDRMVRQFASELGIKMANSLTGPHAIRFFGGLAELNIENAQENYYSCILFFGLPMALGIVTAVINLMKNSKKSYTLSIVFAVLTLLCFLCVKVILPEFGKLYFEINNNITIVLIISALQLAAAVLGRALDKTAV